MPTYHQKLFILYKVPFETERGSKEMNVEMQLLVLVGNGQLSEMGNQNHHRDHSESGKSLIGSDMAEVSTFSWVAAAPIASPV